MKEILLLILGGVLANNFAFEKFLGVSPLLGYARKEEKLIALGLAVTVVMLVTALIAAPLSALLSSAGLGYLQLLVFAAIVLLVVYVIDAMLKSMGKCFGVYFPIIALNSAVLGLALLNAAEGYGLAEALANALGGGLGFLLALLLMSGVESRIQPKYVPAAFRGLPISLLAACIISMVLVAFK